MVTHCVTRCFHQFLHFWVGVQVPTFLSTPGQTKAPRHPPLLTMETLVCATLVVAPDLEEMVNSSISRLKGDFRRRDGAVRPVDGADGTSESLLGSREYALRQMECLRRLVTQYVPALFLMGKWVRDCHWKLHGPNPGVHVKDVVQLQTTFLLALCTVGGTSVGYRRF